MIRGAPRLLAARWPSPILRRPRRRLLLLPVCPIPRGSRPPGASFLAAQTLAPTPRLGPPMDPTAPAAPAPAAAAGAEAEANGYEDAAEFEDAEAGGEEAEALATPAGGDEGVFGLPEELARGVVCLECETSPEAAAAGVGGTCRVYVVGTAHVSQVSCCCQS